MSPNFAHSEALRRGPAARLRATGGARSRRSIAVVSLAAAVLSPLPVARAGVPDRVAGVVSAGSGEPWDLLAGPDDKVLLFADGSGGLLGTLDLRTWQTDTVSACTGAAGVALWDDGTDIHVYTGCGDGSVATTTLSDGVLGSVETVADIGDGAVLGVVGDGDLLYVLTDPEDGGYPTLHSLDPDTATVDGASGFPTATSSSGYQDIELRGDQAFVLHGGDNLSKITLSGGGLASETGSLTSLEGRDLVISSSGGSILAGGGSTVATFNTGDNAWQLDISSGDGLEDVDALALLEQDGTLAVADGGRAGLLMFSWDSATGTVGNLVEDELAWPDEDTAVTEMAVVLDDYLVAGTIGGDLWVATDRPWVEVSSTEPTTAGSGETIEVGFSSDTDGDWSLLLGTDTDDGGTVLAEGSVAAGETVTAQAVVDDTWVEGDNQLRVVVTDDSGRTGHDATVVTVDTPPGRVSLSSAAVGVADGYLTLSFTVPSDADIASATVYVTTVAFDASDWPEGGPDYEGPDALAAPIQLDVSPDESVEVELSPLTNGTLYYMAVRVTDSGGLEGPMSEVVSGTPEETWSASEISGEDGGFCGLPGAASALLAGLGGLLALGRRRRGGAWIGLSCLLLPLSARAADGALADGALADATGADTAAPFDALPTVEELVVDEDDDPAHAGIELRFGPMWFDGGNAIAEVLGDGGHNILWLEGGPNFWKVLQVSLGTGFYRKKGTLLTDSGTASTQGDLLYAVPVTANLNLRLDLLDEQPIVPYATVGGDYWFWRESWETDASGGHAGIGGGKAGYHFGVGGQLLLDIFERSRADTARSRLGIVDSYLTVEWRRQAVGVFSDGLDLSNDQLSVGIRVHHR